MKCPNCQKDIPESSNFCKYCGTRIVNDIEKNDVKLSTEIKPNSSLSNILMMLFLFIAVTESTFLIMYFSEFGLKKDVFRDDISSNEIIEKTNFLNYGGMILTIPKEIKYEINNGELLLEKTGNWNAIITGIKLPYGSYVNQKEVLKNRLITFGYNTSEYNELDVLEKNRLVFKTEIQNNNHLIVYSPFNNRSLVIEIMNKDGSHNIESLAEILTIIDNSKAIGDVITFKNSIYIKDAINR